MKDQLDAIRADFDALPLMARMAAGAFSGRVFSLLESIIDRVEALEARGPLPQLPGDSDDGTRTDRSL